MSPQDDPEERIRQLEQQSANYGAVELGASETSGAASTSPLPPPVYPAPPYGGDPYQGNPYQPPFGTQYTPMPKKSGIPTGLIVGVIAFVVVAVFAGVGAAVWSFMSSNTPNVTIRPGNPGGSIEVPGGPTINIPTMPSVPTMPSIPMMPGDESQQGRPGEPLSIAGIDKNQTVACNDAIATVSGVNNTVKLTGHCLSVTVSGVNNRVTIEATDEIGASGFDNQVIYLSGDPQIDATGSNTVQRG